jgi:DNA sulfur modification protein DndB
LKPITLPVIAGKMGDVDYYVTTMSVADACERLYFSQTEWTDDTPEEEKYQRKINQNRLPSMVYYLGRPKHFYAPVVACVDTTDFVPASTDGNGKVTSIVLSPSAKCPIQDGQHRIKSFTKAHDDGEAFYDELSKESIGVVFIAGLDDGDKQQLFSDLNRNAKLPAKAIGILFEHREAAAGIARAVAGKRSLAGRVVLEANVFNKKTEGKFITLSVLYEMVKSFILVVPNAKKGSEQTKANIAKMETEDEIATYISNAFEDIILPSLHGWDGPDGLKNSKTYDVANDLRKNYICYSSTMWQAIGRAVALMLDNDKNDRAMIAKRLKAIDWSMKNPEWKAANLLDGKGGVLSRTAERESAKELISYKLNQSELN